MIDVDAYLYTFIETVAMHLLNCEFVRVIILYLLQLHIFCEKYDVESCIILLH